MAAEKVAGTLRLPFAAVNETCRLFWWTLLLAAAGPLFFSPPAAAQIGGVHLAPIGELSEVVQVDEADHAAVALLEVAKAQIAQRQWAEALEKLRQVEETAGRKLFKLDDRRFIPLREYCQQLMAGLPEEALSTYRDRVDPLAKNWYDEGVAARDSKLLEKVVDQFFVSSYGDDALFALGEIALERGEYQQARWHWERISRELRSDRGLPLWLASPAATSNQATPWLAYPDTDLNLADVRARLMLVSILEGNLPRARIERQLLTKHHPGAKGKLGGREVVYAEALAEMIEAAKTWPNQTNSSRDWPTFAGAQSRQRVVPRPLALKDLQIVSLPVQLPVFVETSHDFALAPVPKGRLSGGLAVRRGSPTLSYFPVVASGLLLVNTADEIFAFDANTGKPAWQGDSIKPGRIFSGGEGASIAKQNVRAAAPAFGAPQFTLTVFDRWLLARMGSPITARAVEQPRAFNASYVVCLDLQAEGRLHWKLTPDDARWAFEGSPVCDGTNVYVAMRYSDGTGSPQEHVACFDLQTGTRRWRQIVCAAQSNALGLGDDVTHNLLTFSGDALYLNTNLGAVAALDPADGRIRWLATYPRNKRIDKTLSADRDLNPAVYDRGSLFVAPADFAGIIALDASTGLLLWASELPNDVVHLLGVSGGKLWASGKTLWALDAKGGKVEYHSATSTASSKAMGVVGHGRGLLAGDNVYWPVRAEIEADKSKRVEYEIRVFDAQAAKALPPVRLSEFNPPCESGNLVMTDQHFVIAGTDRISLFALPPPRTNNAKPEGKAASSSVEP